MKLSDIGPGLLLAATGIGVGDMVSSTIAGAEYGLTLVWGLAAGVVLKFAITEGAARWQLGTGDTLIEAWRDHLPRAVVLAFFIYFIVWSYFVSSALVAASAMVPAAIIPSVPMAVWGFGVIGLVDNLFRFLLTKRLGNIHPLITVFGVIIGIQLFGFIGLIFGPILIALFILLLRIYSSEFIVKKREVKP